VSIGTEEFDATDYVLSMSLNWIHELRDHDESSDVIGEALVNHDGPFEVDITESILSFFGVESPIFAREAPAFRPGRKARLHCCV